MHYIPYSVDSDTRSAYLHGSTEASFTCITFPTAWTAILDLHTFMGVLKLLQGFDRFIIIICGYVKISLKVSISVIFTTSNANHGLLCILFFVIKYCFAFLSTWMVNTFYRQSWTGTEALPSITRRDSPSPVLILILAIISFVRAGLVII